MERSLTFASGLAEWIASRCLNKRPKTLELYHDVHRLMLRAWPSPDWPVSEITAGMVLDFGQAFSGQCVTRWNLAVAALRALTPEARLLKRRAVRVREFTPPSQAQFAALLSEADRAPHSRAGLVLRFLCFSGLRIGEARALTWSQVTSAGLLISAASSKNGRARLVPLTPALAEVLARLLGVTGPAEYVLPRANPRKAIETASRRAGLAPWSVHTCRHFFATRCLESGVDLPTVARWLGHLDGGGLLARTYFHLADAHSREAAARVHF